MSTIHVGPPTGPQAYDVVVGRDVTSLAAQAVPQDAAAVMFVHARAVAGLVERLAAHLRVRGRRVHRFEVPDGEAAKTPQVVARVWDELGQASFTRTDVVVGVGGGAVTDVAGFIAASWLRGVRVVQVPTTLLAMVDAAVGGKTGINIEAGKNLVGAFHPPSAVVCDLDTLSTLPRRDLAAGLAEVVKCGFIADPVILDLVQSRDRAEVMDPAGPVLAELVERAIRVKAQVVTADLTESCLREVLNYGHTFAHAVEQAEGYTWRHGDAVAVGMVFVAELTRAAGVVSPARGEALVARHRAVLHRLGLPIEYQGADLPELLAVMGRDKKARGGTLRFVVLTGEDGCLADVGRLENPPEAALRAAFEAVRPQE